MTPGVALAPCDPDRFRTLRGAGEHGPVDVSVDRMGGGLHRLRVGGVDLVHSYGRDDAPPAAAGAVLFPWPNRVRDATWRHGGRRRQLRVTEPERGHALHGLVTGQVFDVEAVTDTVVVVSRAVGPEPGYPFQVMLRLEYAATADGVTIRSEVRNASGVRAPVALGAHPYLALGDMPAEGLVLRVPASTRLTMDERLIPVGIEQVDGTEHDLRAGAVIGDRAIHACYTGLRREDDVVVCSMEAPGGGPRVEMWADEAFGFVQVYACDTYPRPRGGRTRAVAVEPMTAAPDAFNSGLGLRWLDPSEVWTASWGIRLRP